MLRKPDPPEPAPQWFKYQRVKHQANRETIAVLEAAVNRGEIVAESDRRYNEAVKRVLDDSTEER